jgi:hypothetical protein
VSPERDQFILKGALLFATWVTDPFRPTRDLGLLGAGEPSVERMSETFRAICAVVVEDDGVAFDRDGLRVAPIRSDDAHGGVRVKTTATIAKTKISIQVDIGFGDAVTPGPVEITFPLLLPDRPAAVLMAFPVETVVAEKFEVMVSLGQANTRLKDFYDLWCIAQTFELQHAVVSMAVRNTFASGRRFCRIAFRSDRRMRLSPPVARPGGHLLPGTRLRACRQSWQSRCRLARVPTAADRSGGRRTMAAWDMASAKRAVTNTPAAHPFGTPCRAPVDKSRIVLTPVKATPRPRAAALRVTGFARDAAPGGVGTRNVKKHDAAAASVEQGTDRLLAGSDCASPQTGSSPYPHSAYRRSDFSGLHDTRRDDSVVNANSFGPRASAVSSHCLMCQVWSGCRSWRNDR